MLSYSGSTGANVTSDDIRGQLNKEPFTPFRVHLVSGKTLDVPHSGAAWILRNALLIFQADSLASELTPYDVVALRNIERLEQLSRERDKE
jgi:hypothetical protein